MKREEVYAIGYPAKNAYMPFIDFVLDYAIPNDTIPNLGEGEGAYSAKLLKRVFDCINVAINQKYAKRSKELGVNSIISSATFLAIKDMSFGVVLMVETLEHIVDFESALSEAKGVARKFEFVLITVPNCGVFEQLKRLHLMYDHFLATDRVNFFTKGDLEQILSKYFSEFNVCEKEPIWIWLSYLFPRYIIYIINIMINFGVINSPEYYRIYASVEV